jgi:small subunit ribosomal protein S8
MSVTDPIADLLACIRNASTAGFPTVRVPASNLKAEVCRVLAEEGFIRGVEREDDGKQGILNITLKYDGEDRTPVITEIRRVSRPSLRVYKHTKDKRQVRSGLGISILTTSRGVMTDRRARTEHVGGEVLCEVWSPPRPDDEELRRCHELEDCPSPSRAG